MEQHPVPRNISSFHFHLIGDMTLRQFTYLAAGVGGGFVFFKLSPLPSIISIAIALFIGFVGIAFAFIPIQERPLDRWLVVFIRSIFSPTQYLWCKKNIPPEILTKTAIVQIPMKSHLHAEAHKEARTKLQNYLASLPTLPHETLNTQEKNYIEKTISLFDSSSVVVSPPLVKKASLPLRSSVVKPTATPPAKEISQTPPIKTSPPSPPPELKPASSPKPPTLIEKKPPPSPPSSSSVLQKQLTELASEKESLLKELESLKNELKRIKQPAVVKPEQAVQTKEKTTVKTVTPKAALEEIGIPQISQIPNLVVGIIKDPQKKLLPNIIITIKNKDGLPLRALKTNKLGQFSTATPLPNGTYLLEIEDPQHHFVFDIVEIALSGKVFLPIEIIAKGKKELMREKLTKELFGSANI